MMQGRRRTWMLIGTGYACAVFVGVMGICATLEVSDALAYGRLPLFVLIPGKILQAIELTVQVMPVALLLAAPFTLLGTLILWKGGWLRWWHFAMAGALCPLSGIVLLQMVTSGRFFPQSEVIPLGMALVPTGVVSACIYWLIGFHSKGNPKGTVPT